MRSGQKSKMTAEQNERGYVPRHDEDGDAKSHNEGAQGRDVTQVFRRQEKRVGTITFHEGPVHHAEEKEPEDQQNLIFTEMQEEQLHG